MSLDDPNRPRLKLQPRSTPAPVGTLADTDRNKAIFGDARPRDERVVEERKRKESEKSGQSLCLAVVSKWLMPLALLVNRGMREARRTTLGCSQAHFHERRKKSSSSFSLDRKD